MREFIRRLVKGDASEPEWSPEEAAGWVSRQSQGDLFEYIETFMLCSHAALMNFRQTTDRASLDEAAALVGKTKVIIDELLKRTPIPDARSDSPRKGTPSGPEA